MDKAELEQLQRQVNPESARELVDNKFKFFLKCNEADLATPEILAVIGTKLPLEADIPLVGTAQELDKVLQSFGEGQYILKSLGGSHGKGIIRFSYQKFQLLDDNRNKILTDDIIEKIKPEKATFILQACIQPHPALSTIMPTKALGTARIISVNDNGKVSILFACLKIPVGNNIADNFVAGTSKNLLSNVDLADGVIALPFGPDKEETGIVTRVALHPDNSQKIEGFVFPNWQEIIALVKSGAQEFSDLYTIGWDVALTDVGPMLIEANWRYDCDILQVAEERGLKGDLESLLKVN